MDSTTDVTYVDPKLWNEAWALRACNVASAGIIAYEFLTHIDDEVEYFWKKRWSPGKLLFLWSRYFSLAFVLGNTSVFVTQNPSEDVCDRFFHWQNGGAALAIITSHIVLELRLYAMYRGIRWATIILFALPILESIAVGILFGIPNQAWGGNEAAPGIGMCADGDIKGKRFEVYYPMTTLIIEVILLSLSLWQSWIHRNDGLTRGSLIRILTRGSVFYFICLFWVYLMVQIFWILNIYTLNELSTSFEFTFSAIFANRLMIDLRKMYYSPNRTLRTDDVNTGTMLSWSVAAGSGGSTTIGNFSTLPASVKYPSSSMSETQPPAVYSEGEYELATFSEAAGF